MIPWRLSAFVVQGFFFLSGVKLVLGAKEPFDTKGFYLRRVKTVVLPYVGWVLVYYCWFVYHGYFPFSWVDLGKHLILGNLVSPFYFVVTIVQFYLLAPVFLKVVKKLSPAALLGGSLAIMVFCWKKLPWMLEVAGLCEGFRYNDRVFTTYLFYFVLGCVAGRHYESFCAWLKKRRVTLILVFLVLAAGDVWIYARLLCVVGGFFADLFHMAYCVGAILAVQTLGLWMAERGMSRMLAAMDRVTYPVFLFHSLVIFWLNDKMSAFGLWDLAARFVLRLAVVYPAAFGLCMDWQALCRRIRQRS